MDEVFDDINYSFDGPVTPVLVDENDQPVPGSRSADGGLVLRGFAPPDAYGARAAPAGAFACKKTGSVSVDQTEVWDTTLPLPIQLELENTNVLHRFDAGSFFPSRPPFLLLQFSGQLVATVGVHAKLGFECELSDLDFRGSGGDMS